MTNTNEQTGLDEAISKAGGVQKLAEITGISFSAIYKWRKRGGVVPVDFVATVSDKTGVARYRLNPTRKDLFPHPKKGKK